MPEDNREKTYLTFVVQDFEDHHDEITKTIGIQPSEAYMAGDKKILKNGQEFAIKHNIWQLKSNSSISLPASEQLTNMLDKLEPHKHQIGQLGDKYTVTFSFGLYFDDWQPGIFLEKELIKRVAKFNADVDFDLYFMSEE